MFCKNCGNEIKDREKFCTNCGQPVKRVIKVNIVIVTIIILIIVTIVCCLLKIKSSNKSEEINTSVVSENIQVNEETEQNKEQEKKYITQDSEVSPTGKEFIGEYSSNFTSAFPDMVKGNSRQVTKIYTTSYININMYDIDINTNNKSIFEIIYYFNTSNNKFIGAGIRINDISTFKDVLNYIDMDYNSFVNTFSRAFETAFNNFHNDNSQENQDRYLEYSEYINNNFSNVQSKELNYNNYIFSYSVFGDVLVITTGYNNDNNKSEWLILAHNENNNPEEEIKLWYDTVFKGEEDKNFKVEDNLPNNNTDNINANTQTENTNNTSNNQKNESELDPETTHYIHFNKGFELEGYTEDLDNWGIRYKVVKEENLDYDNNVVTNIEPNYCYVDKNTTVTLTVSDNTYNMDVIVDVNYLLQLAGLDRYNYGDIYDYETGEYVTNNVKLLLKINGKTIFDGQVEPVGIVHAESLGKIKGKPTDTYKVEATVEDIKITKEINYYARCDTTTQRFEIYAGGDIGGG